MFPNQTEWQNFYKSIKRHTGLDLAKYKANQLQRRIWTMAESKGLTTLNELFKWLENERENVTWFLDRLAINVSELFRNPEKWDELKNVVIPDLLKRSPKLKCWSAGCSYGAEAHSLAMLLDASFSGQHTIVGTDIDEAALAQARSGVFSESDVKCVPQALKQKYLVQEADTWKALPTIKKYLSFQKQNILDDPFDRNFDLILCRNVVIYFTDEAKDELYRRFFEALKPGGVLLVGGTERIFSSDSIGFVSTMPFFYQKPVSGDNKWRNAS